MSHERPLHTHPQTEAANSEMVAACPRCQLIARELEDWGPIVVQVHSGIAFASVSTAEQARLTELWRPLVETRAATFDTRVQMFRSSGLSMEDFLKKYPPSPHLIAAVERGVSPPPRGAEALPWTVPWEPAFVPPPAPSTALSHNHPFGRVTAAMRSNCPRCVAQSAEHEALVVDAVQLYSCIDFCDVPESERARAIEQWRQKVNDTPGPSSELVYRWRESGLSRSEFMHKERKRGVARED
jgi:hypothetical protein